MRRRDSFCTSHKTSPCLFLLQQGYLDQISFPCHLPVLFPFLRLSRCLFHSFAPQRANTSINLSGAVADGSDIFRSCSNILDKFGSKPSRFLFTKMYFYMLSICILPRDNMAVVNGTARIGRSPATNSSFKVAHRFAAFLCSLDVEI